MAIRFTIIKTQPVRFGIIAILLICLFAGLTVTANAASVKTTGGWQYKTVKGGVAIVGYQKKMKQAEVPKKIAGKKVKQVNVTRTSNTFYKCTMLIIPSYVATTKIGEDLDADDSRVTRLFINSKKIIGQKRDSSMGLNELIIGPRVRYIGKNSFYLVSMNDKRLTIKNGVQKIGDYAFRECSLGNATLPKTVKKIGKYAFKDNYPNFKLYGKSAATRAYVKKYKLNALSKKLLEFVQSSKYTREDEKECYDVFEYTGGAVEPMIEKSNIGYKESEYKIAYSDNIEPGRGKATIEGQGYYEGSSVVKSFLIAPPVIRNAEFILGTREENLNQLDISWNEVYGPTSYRVLALRANGSDINKTTTDTSCSIKLESGETYDIYIYSMIEIGGKIYYIEPSKRVARVKTLK